MALWAGRFKKEIDKTTNDFNSSISFDQRMYKQDIEGSIAHATMLGEQNIISKSDADVIVAELKAILCDLESGALLIDENAEDIHMFVEQELTNRLSGVEVNSGSEDFNIGKRDGCTIAVHSEDFNIGKRLHTARSRNDQVALDLRMNLKVEVAEIISKLKSLTNILCDVSDEHTDTIMCGYTHLQRAQPITLAHHLMAYAQMFLRDIDRLYDANRRMDSMPLGSGALASTTYPICRERVAELLSFASVTQNSLDGVSDRDFCIEIASDLSIIMMHLSRFCEEIILWCSWEFKFIELDDAFATGSSIMPQKKNPDIAELIRGKTGRVYGSLITLLTVMKGIPLAYNKDMQEDKEAIFDAVDTVKLCIDTFSPMLKTMTVLKDNMRLAAAKGFINATDCADYLVKKGLPFRDAYKITGTLVAQCIDEGVVLETLPIEKYKAICENFDEDIYTAISLSTCVSGRSVVGGPAEKTVKAQINTVRERLL